MGGSLSDFPSGMPETASPDCASDDGASFAAVVAAGTAESAVAGGFSCVSMTGGSCTGGAGATSICGIATGKGLGGNEMCEIGLGGTIAVGRATGASCLRGVVCLGTVFGAV